MFGASVYLETKRCGSVPVSGRPVEDVYKRQVLMHMIRVKFLRPPVRKYETENYYETDPEQIRQSPDAGKPKGGKTVAKKEK